MEQGAASKLSERAHERGIAVIDTVTGYTLAPEVDGKVLGSEEFHELPEEEQERLGGIMEEVKEDLKETMKQVPRWQQEVRKEFKALDREFAGRTVDILITELMEKYEALPAVVDYLEAVKQDIVEPFSRSEGKDGKTVSVDAPAFGDYRVNVLVDNAETDGALIVYEDNPTYQNLMGRIEHLANMGTLLTNFTLIKAGALHYANGGYLVLDAEKVLTNPFAWDGLKRVLNAEEIRIESLERQLSLVSTISLEPEPIAIDLKVILIGDRYLYPSVA